MIRARPTTYKGIQMRSRLEASWAAFFDEQGRTWEYEPMCFADETGQYLPDFRVHGLPHTGPIYVEIKPPLDDDELRGVARRMAIIWQSEPDVELQIISGSVTGAVVILSGRILARSGGQAWEMCDRDGPAWYWLVGVKAGHSNTEVATELPDGTWLIEPIGAAV